MSVLKASPYSLLVTFILVNLYFLAPATGLAELPPGEPPIAPPALSAATGTSSIDPFVPSRDQSPPSAMPVILPAERVAPPEPPAVPPVSTYLWEFFPDMAAGTKEIFSSRNLELAVFGAALTAAAASVDHVDRNTKNYFQTRRPMGRVSIYGDRIGQGYYHVGLGSALFGIGELSHDRKLADTGIVTLEALLVNCVATEGLKYAVGRKRPNGDNAMSFPSGHASSSATVAASISAMYGWDLRIAVPLYSVALFVGASRIQDNEHYLSDVIAGLTLGSLVGSSFAHYHTDKVSHPGFWKKLSIAPIVEKDFKGSLVTYAW